MSNPPSSPTLPIPLASSFVLAAATVLVAAGCGAPEAPQFPQLVLFNGRVVTQGPAGALAQALAVQDGRFVAVGADGPVRATAGPQTRVIDLGGRTVIPGIGDNHFHSIGGGPGVDLSGARNLDDVARYIAGRAAGTPAGEVIVTNSDWHEGQLEEQRLPLRDDLDRAAPNHAVVVVRGGHEYVLNSAALARFGITDSVPDVEGGRIGRYEDGRLNGELVDLAKGLVTLPPQPERTPEEELDALASQHTRLNQLGVTSVRYAGGSEEGYRRLGQLAATGRLTVRVEYLFRLPRGTGAGAVDSVTSSWGVAPGEGNDWLRVGGVKLGVDGGFEGGLMSEPYAEPWGADGTYYGLQTLPAERLVEVTAELNRLGWRVATHAVGDSAIDLVLDAYEAADRERSIQDRRWVIEHAFTPRTDQFPRMRSLGLHVTLQNHLYVAAPSLRQYWGDERADWVSPARALLDAGIPFSTGTDSPVVPFNPWWTLHHFETRNTLSGGVAGPDQRIDRLRALRQATAGYAELVFAEDRRGTIEVGRQADFVVVDADLFTLSAARAVGLASELTVVGGRVVWQGDSFGAG